MTLRRGLNGYLHALLGPLMSIALSGCTDRSAPMLAIVGAYFPAWMLCALLGILVAIGARAGFVVSGLAGIVPFQLFVCASIGVCAGLLVWLLWFGQ